MSKLLEKISKNQQQCYQWQFFTFNINNFFTNKIFAQKTSIWLTTRENIGSVNKLYLTKIWWGIEVDNLIQK